MKITTTTYGRHYPKPVAVATASDGTTVRAVIRGNETPKQALRRVLAYNRKMAAHYSETAAKYARALGEE